MPGVKNKSKKHEQVQVREVHILKPMRLRLYALYVLVFVLFFGVGVLLRLLFNPDSPSLDHIRAAWQAYVVMIFGGPLVLALTDARRWQVRVVMDESLEGLANPLGRLTLLNLGEIDWPRTRASLASWLGLGRLIYGRSGKTILINPWFYRKGDFMAFLEMIGG